MRSNRPLTQFAIRKLQEFLSGEPHQFTPAQEGNTAVSINLEGDFHVLGFWLHGERILELMFDGPRFEGAIVYDGNFYDGAGNPSTTTRERLNGLLDELGESCLIPEGVRVFNDKESGKAYVGRGSVRMPLGRGQLPVHIDANAVRLTLSTNV